MNLHELTIEQATQGLSKREFSSRDLTQACLDRIAGVDKELGAFLFVAKETALEQADAADDRLRKGSATPLTGIPLALKDNILVRALPATAGSKILAPYRAAYNATVVDKLVSDGAVILGKTNMDEFAMGSSTETSAFQTTKNPWNRSRVPGGSSGGSAAAVASDECIAGLGSDTGGSIRQPAAFCGVIGFKPTYGRVSRYGLIAMTSSLDQIGPITKTVRDAAILGLAISGVDRRDATTTPAPDFSLDGLEQSLDGMVFGVPKEFFLPGMDPDVEASVKQAIQTLEKKGARVQELSIPTAAYSLATYYILVTSEVSTNLARYDGVRYGASQHHSAKTLIEGYFKTRAAGFGDETKRRILLGTFTLSAGYYEQYYQAALRSQRIIRKEFAEALEKVDCLVAPTTPTVAFKLGEKFDDPLMMYLSDIFTVSANIANLPAISVPCGFANGLPIGVQFMAKPFEEQTVLRAGYQFERARGFERKAPTL